MDTELFELVELSSGDSLEMAHHLVATPGKRLYLQKSQDREHSEQLGLYMRDGVEMACHLVVPLKKDFPCSLLRWPGIFNLIELSLGIGFEMIGCLVVTLQGRLHSPQSLLKSPGMQGF